MAGAEGFGESSLRSRELHAATMLRTEVSGDRGLPLPARRAATGREKDVSGGSGAER